MADRVADRHELLDVGELAHVDLLGQVAADRVLERLAADQVAAREGERAGERRLCPLPEEHLQTAVPHLEDDGEYDVGWLLVHRRSRLEGENLVDWPTGFLLTVDNLADR